jgi:hypothetical protein
MELQTLIIPVIYSLLKAHIILIGIVAISYIIEKITPLRLLYDHFKWEKSVKNAEAALDLHTFLYILFIMSVLIYDIYIENVKFEVLPIVIWISLMIIFVRFFRKYYNKYQGVDKNKSDNDFS